MPGPAEIEAVARTRLLGEGSDCRRKRDGSQGIRQARCICGPRGRGHDSQMPVLIANAGDLRFGRRHRYGHGAAMRAQAAAAGGEGRIRVRKKRGRNRQKAENQCQQRCPDSAHVGILPQVADFAKRGQAAGNGVHGGALRKGGEYRINTYPPRCRSSYFALTCSMVPVVSPRTKFSAKFSSVGAGNKKFLPWKQAERGSSRHNGAGGSLQCRVRASGESG